MSRIDVTAQQHPVESFRPSVVLAGGAAVGAGVIHAAAAGSHIDHGLAGWALLAAALAGIGWGAVALRGAPRGYFALGALMSGAFLVVWIASRTTGIAFVDGLAESEPVGWPDGVAAALALATIVACVAARRDASDDAGSRRVAAILTRPVVVALVLASVPAAALAARGHDGAVVAVPGGTATIPVTGHTHGDVGTPVESGGPSESPTAPPRPYDPSKPVDLSGTPGVTPAQQRDAESLVIRSLKALPRYASTDKALADGFWSIGDEFTGYEHYIKWAAIDDGHILDPEHPESLVYAVDGAKRTLVAAMFVLPASYSLDDTPDIGGALIQWHVHGDLCFTTGPSPRVAGTAPVGSDCPAGLQRLASYPMIHVWIVPNECGPFAALEGIGAGQVGAGEVRACDHAHGSASTTF